MNELTENIFVVLAVIVLVVILLLLGTLSVERQNEFMDVFLLSSMQMYANIW